MCKAFVCVFLGFAMEAMAQRNRSCVQKLRFSIANLTAGWARTRVNPDGRGGRAPDAWSIFHHLLVGVVSLEMSHLDMDDMVLFGLHVEFLMRICHVDPCSMFPILTDPQLTLFQGINAGVMLWQPNQEMLDEMLAELD